MFCMCPCDTWRTLKVVLWSWDLPVLKFWQKKRFFLSSADVSCASFISCFPLLSSGSEDGKIHVWNGESGMKVAVLDGKHTGPITCLQFNPKFMTFASACSNMVRKWALSSSELREVLTLPEMNLGRLSASRVCLQKVAAPTGCCRTDLCSAMKRCFLSSSVGLLVANYRRLIPVLWLLSDGSVLLTAAHHCKHSFGIACIS